MPCLKVQKFSCIETATLELGRVTVLIGPQASGKSVLCKLAYFFVSMLHEQSRCIAERMTFEGFKEFLSDRFLEWFPPEAWGRERFLIEFGAGPYKVRLIRTKYGEKLSADSFRIWIAPVVQDLYESTLEGHEKTHPQSGEEEFNVRFQVERAYRSALANFMGPDNIDFQVFIPAGRSFFTSVGKAIAAFEQGNVLDPLIVRFGRTLAAYRERPPLTKDNAGAHEINKYLSAIFGGSYKKDREREYVLTSDGRRVPLFALSSGQQELLPLLVVLPWMVPTRSTSRRIVYVEEPEAHLFPQSQSELVELFARMSNKSDGTLGLVLTTHSPYVLAKLNNLLKAGALGYNGPVAKRDLLQSVIPSEAWMVPGSVRAYALQDGILAPIVDEDSGLIDAEYLDAISGEIAQEFSALLEIEHER